MVITSRCFEPGGFGSTFRISVLVPDYRASINILRSIR
jgi:hypothetical protein